MSDATADIANPEVAGAPGNARTAAPRQYTGDGLAVSWDASRCIHAARCIAELPTVFDPKRRPWIDLSRGGDREVAAAVRACPSGALRYTPAAPGALPREQPPAVAEVEVALDGPYYVRGEVTLCDAGGTVLAEGESRLALCRCGATGNAPFCDNSHLAVKFANDPSGHEENGGPAGGPQLRIQPDEPGPYHVSGGVRVTGPGGVTLAEGQEFWLCRCGKSGNKPFCDGSHNAA